MFVAWAVLAGLAGELHLENADEVEQLRLRSISPVHWFQTWCDEEFTSEDLNDQGNAFTQSYYASNAGEMLTGKSSYLDDYQSTFPEYDELYQVPDSWDTFDRLRPIIEKRWLHWLSPPKPGWRKWFQ